MEINKKDWKFIPTDPEPGFDPRRNKAIIDRTIAKYERQRALKKKIFKDHLAERSEAVASFLTSPKGAAYSTNRDKVVRYFGKRELARLRGEQIVDEIRGKVGSIVDGAGKIKGLRVSDVGPQA